MKNNVMWGLLLIIIGLVFGLNALNITDINLFFDGWWAFIIIIPCFTGLFKEKEKLGNVIGILIGLALLISAQDIISFDDIMKLLFPLLIIIVGISIMFKDRVHKKVKEKLIKESKGNSNEYYATFASQNINLKDKDLENVELNAVFGGMKCDLSDCNIEKDNLIKIFAIFGSVKLKVPSDVKVIVNSVPIFGGVNTKVKDTKNKDAKTIYVDAISVFGGVEIK